MKTRVWLLLLVVFATMAPQLRPTHTACTSKSAALRDGTGPVPPWRDGTGPVPPWQTRG
jgi:hypothetical protein